MKKNSSFERVAPFLLFASLAFLFFCPFITGKLSFIWDTRVFGFPNLNMVTRFLSDGQVLIWNPYNFSGYPFAGDIETGLFYPINWLFSLISGVLSFQDLGIYFAFHFFLGASFAYLLFQKITNNAFAATLAAIIYAYSGYALGHISHMGQLLMYMWVPLVIYAYLVALEKREWLVTLLAGASFALAISVGHFNTAVYLLLGLFILCALSLLKNQYWKSTAVHAFAATIFAFFAIGILFGPVLEFAMQSNRAELTLEQQSEEWSLNPENLIGLVSANHNHILEDELTQFDGSVDITQNYLYVGLLALLLAALGIFSRKKYKIFFILFGTVALFAALGKYTPINAVLFYAFPGFNKARMAVQIMGMFFLCLAALTAFGMDVFLSHLKKKYILPVAIILICLVSADIIGHGYNRRFYSEEFPSTEVYENSSDQALMSLLQGDENFRISDEIQVMDANKWELQGIENVWGNGGIKLANYNALFERTGPFTWRANFDELYDFLNVKYLFTDREINPEHFQHIEGNLYLNQQVLPRAYLVHNYTLSKPLEEVNFLEEVLLENEPTYLGEKGTADSESIEILTQTANTLQLEATLTTPGILVLSEVDAPGWTLIIDGQKATYLLANTAFRAVPLTVGSHRVEFNYRPLSFLLGALSTSLSMLLLAGLALYQYCPWRKY